MKLLIMAVLVCGHAHADTCTERVQAAFDMVKPRAVAYHRAMGPASWDFKWFMPDNIIAQVRHGSVAIAVNEALMCTLPDFEIEAIIAHEFGHLISRRSNATGERMLTMAGREDKANYYGAKLIPDSTKYLQLIDGRCTKGSTYDCETASSWRDGLIN